MASSESDGEVVGASLVDLLWPAFARTHHIEADGGTEPPSHRRSLEAVVAAATQSAQATALAAFNLAPRRTVAFLVHGKHADAAVVECGKRLGALADLDLVTPPASAAKFLTRLLAADPEGINDREWGVVLTVCAALASAGLLDLTLVAVDRLCESRDRGDVDDGDDGDGSDNRTLDLGTAFGRGALTVVASHLAHRLLGSTDDGSRAAAAFDPRLARQLVVLVIRSRGLAQVLAEAAVAALVQDPNRSTVVDAALEAALAERAPEHARVVGEAIEAAACLQTLFGAHRLAWEAWIDPTAAPVRRFCVADADDGAAVEVLTGLSEAIVAAFEEVASPARTPSEVEAVRSCFGRNIRRNRRLSRPDQELYAFLFRKLDPSTTWAFGSAGGHLSCTVVADAVSIYDRLNKIATSKAAAAALARTSEAVAALDGAPFEVLAAMGPGRVYEARLASRNPAWFLPLGSRTQCCMALDGTHSRAVCQYLFDYSTAFFEIVALGGDSDDLADEVVFVGNCYLAVMPGSDDDDDPTFGSCSDSGSASGTGPSQPAAVLVVDSLELAAKHRLPADATSIPVSDGLLHNAVLANAAAFAVEWAAALGAGTAVGSCDGGGAGSTRPVLIGPYNNMETRPVDLRSGSWRTVDGDGDDPADQRTYVEGLSLLGSTLFPDIYLDSCLGWVETDDAVGGHLAAEFLTLTVNTRPAPQAQE